MIVVTLTVTDTELKISEGSSFFVKLEDKYDLQDFYNFKKDLSHILKYSIKEYGEDENEIQE